jgi:hypothetical protein
VFEQKKQSQVQPWQPPKLDFLLIVGRPAAKSKSTNSSKGRQFQVYRAYPAFARKRISVSELAAPAQSNDEHIVLVEARVDMPKVYQSAREEAGAEQEQVRNSHLRDDERFTQAETQSKSAAGLRVLF